MTQRTTSGGGLFCGLDYRQALELVDSSPGASRELRARSTEDQQRSVLASMQGAQSLYTLQRQRVDALLSVKRRVDRQSMEDAMPDPLDTTDPLDGLTYDEAVQRVISDPSTPYKLRQRILEDAQRDPVDSLNDAEVLCALQKLRLDAVMSAAGLQSS